VVKLTPALTAMAKLPVAVLPAESVTLAVKLVVPVAVGLPVMAPPEERLRPAGKVVPPESDQLYGKPEPPVAARVCE